MGDGERLPGPKTIYLVRHGLSEWNAESRIQGNSNLSHVSPRAAPASPQRAVGQSVCIRCKTPTAVATIPLIRCAQLTKVGEEQAARCRAALANHPFDSCFTSPIVRAKRFAEIVWEGRPGPLIELPDLQEANLGLLQGMFNADAAEQYPELYKTWRTQPEALCLDGRCGAGYIKGRVCDRAIASTCDDRRLLVRFRWPIAEVFEQSTRAWATLVSAPGQQHLVVTHKSILRAMLCTVSRPGATTVTACLTACCTFVTEDMHDASRADSRSRRNLTRTLLLCATRPWVSARRASVLWM